MKTLGKRALISVGWGGLGGESVPDDVFLLGNVPYDWLFAKVRWSPKLTKDLGAHISDRFRWSCIMVELELWPPD